MAYYAQPQEVAVNPIQLLNNNADVLSSRWNILLIQVLNILRVADCMRNITDSTDPLNERYVLNVCSRFHRFLYAFMSIPDPNLRVYDVLSINSESERFRLLESWMLRTYGNIERRQFNQL